MDLQKLDKEELSNLLIEKHRNFVKEYRKEYDLIERISVLKEKKEQLDYWLADSKDDQEKNQKYAQLKESSVQELTKLSDELKALYEGKPRRSHAPPEADIKARHKWLASQIAVHDEGATYWLTKKTELSSEKEPKDKPQEKQKPKESRILHIQKKVRTQKKKRVRHRVQKKPPGKDSKPQA